MKKVLLFTISFYQKLISPALETLFGKGCRFYPTCSNYAKQAVDKYGVSKGLVLSLKRFGKCHPFNEGGVDLA